VSWGAAARKKAAWHRTHFTKITKQYKSRRNPQQSSSEAPVVSADRVDALVDARGPWHGDDRLQVRLSVGLAGAQGAAAQGVGVAVDDLGGGRGDGAHKDGGGAPVWLGWGGGGRGRGAGA